MAVALDQLQVGTNLRVRWKATFQRALIALKGRVRKATDLSAPIGCLHGWVRDEPDGDVGKRNQSDNAQCAEDA